MATEDDEDETSLPPAEMHAEPASTADAAQHAARVAASLRQAELQERTRLEEDAIGMNMCHMTQCRVCHIVARLCCPCFDGS